MLYYKHNKSQIRGTGNWREGGGDHASGGGFKMTPNTSVLTLSAVTMHNHKHGHVQMSLKCRLAACGRVSRPWFLQAKARGNHLSPCHDSSFWLGNTNIACAGGNEQVQQTSPSPPHHLKSFDLEEEGLFSVCPQTTSQVIPSAMVYKREKKTWLFATLVLCIYNYSSQL